MAQPLPCTEVVGFLSFYFLPFLCAKRSVYRMYLEGTTLLRIRPTRAHWRLSTNHQMPERRWKQRSKLFTTFESNSTFCGLFRYEESLMQSLSLGPAQPEKIETGSPSVQLYTCIDERRVPSPSLILSSPLFYCSVIFRSLGAALFGATSRLCRATR